MDPRAHVEGLAALQEQTLGDSRVCIAVLDGPVDLSHPSFEGCDLRRVRTLVDDAPGAGQMSVHGTHVTSVIFGQPGGLVQGIAPWCRGLVVPVFRDGRRRLSQLDLARAIEQAVDEGAHVINISGGESSPTGDAEGLLDRSLQLCADQGVLVVAAVGNDGCPCVQVPAARPQVLAVGAQGVDGEPLEISNWGEAYQANGVLAPGQGVEGATPGGGTAAMTGSSFATPVISGLAALLLSRQLAAGGQPDPLAVGQAILKTATPCLPRDDPGCRRHLVGTVNAAMADHAIAEGETVTNFDADRATSVADIDPTPTGTAVEPSCAGAPATAETSDGLGTSASEPAPPTPNSPGAASADPVAPALATPSMGTGTGPSTNVGVQPSSEDCGCGGGTTNPVFAIGTVDVDFGTEARRDSFRQLMPEVTVGEGEEAASLPGNPYDKLQMSDYLNNEPTESAELIWTLNLDLTPIYALEPYDAYAEAVYQKLRAALRSHALPVSDEGYLSRVSIPGLLTNRTRRLFSGQVVPVVAVQTRGFYGWEESKLIDMVLDRVQSKRNDLGPGDIRLAIRTFIDKLYYDLRNLGQVSPDRALNYAGTNLFQLATFLIDRGILSANNIPGAGNELFSLDTIDVQKSQYCRMDSDCWDVRVIFFSPANDRLARRVLQFTIDVSEVMPVSLAPVREFLTR